MHRAHLRTLPNLHIAKQDFCAAAFNRKLCRFLYFQTETIPVSIIWFIIDFFSVPHSFVDYIVLSVVKEQPPHCKLHRSMFHLWLLASCMPFLVIFFPIPKLILQSPPFLRFGSSCHNFSMSNTVVFKWNGTTPLLPNEEGHMENKGLQDLKRISAQSSKSATFEVS